MHLYMYVIHQLTKIQELESIRITVATNGNCSRYNVANVGTVPAALTCYLAGKIDLFVIQISIIYLYFKLISYIIYHISFHIKYQISYIKNNFISLLFTYVLYHITYHINHIYIYIYIYIYSLLFVFCFSDSSWS